MRDGEHGLCLFRALWELLVQNYGDLASYKSLARDFVEAHMALFTDLGCPPDIEAIVNDFPGLSLNELHIFEEHFSVSVNVYCLEDHPGTGRRVAVLIRRGDTRFTGNKLYVDMANDHFQYIPDFNAYSKHYACQICGMHFNKKWNCENHVKSCEGKTTFQYARGYYNPEARALHQQLKRYGIFTCSKDTFMYPFHATFDCESVLEKRTDHASFVATHHLVSISVTSNVPGYEGIVECFRTLTGDVDHLVKEFIDYVTKLGAKATQVLRERLKPTIDSLKSRGDKMREKERAAAERRAAEGGAERDTNAQRPPGAGSRRRDGPNCYEKLLQRVLDWTAEFPLMGYNSGRYDLCLLARPLFKLLEQQLPVKSSENLLNTHPPVRSTSVPPTGVRGAVGAQRAEARAGARLAPAGAEVDLGNDDIFTTVEWPGEDTGHYLKRIIKKGNKFMGIVTNKLRFLDCVNYIAPGFSLSQYLKAFDVEETKSWFCYEWLDSYEKLRQTSLPPYDCFYSELKRQNVLEMDVPEGEDPRLVGETRYRGLQQTWIEQGWETILDYLIYYNNYDVIGLQTAVEKQRKLFATEFGQCMLTSCFSLAGVALNFSFQVAEGRFRQISKNDKDFHQKIQQAICGGPSILFHRYAKAGVTYLKNSSHLVKRILGFDCNSLYLWAIGEELPEGDFCIREGPSFRVRPRKPASQQSDSALGWLKYLEDERQTYIAHAGNGNEVRVGSRELPVDGFESSTATAFQFMGCYFHACMTCYRRKYATEPEVTVHPSYDPLTWSDVARKTAQDVQYLRDLGLQPIIMYQCEWRVKLRTLDNNYRLQEALRPTGAPRRPLFGVAARTAPPVPSERPPPPPPPEVVGEGGQGGGGANLPICTALNGNYHRILSPRLHLVNGIF